MASARYGIGDRDQFVCDLNFQVQPRRRSPNAPTDQRKLFRPRAAQSVGKEPIKVALVRAPARRTAGRTLVCAAWPDGCRHKDCGRDPRKSPAACQTDKGRRCRETRHEWPWSLPRLIVVTYRNVARSLAELPLELNPQVAAQFRIERNLRTKRKTKKNLLSGSFHKETAGLRHQARRWKTRASHHPDQRRRLIARLVEICICLRPSQTLRLIVALGVRDSAILTEKLQFSRHGQIAG